MNEIQFQRGPYGGNFPPLLLSHITPEEAWKRYYAFNLSIGIKLDGPKTKRKNRSGTTSRQCTVIKFG